jgi:uncharacterized radical SAM protein YgiQ
MFIPATMAECRSLDWQGLDVVLVTGDAYVDTPYSGIAIIGKYLIKQGYKVGIISQPLLDSSEDILRLGTPRLFWGVTAGAMDSMVSNYTALKKRRKNDVLTAGGVNNKRPDRATIRYVNLIKQHSDKRVPVVIGGIEASLRRLSHYDYWDNSLRKSILLDSKADILVYGEGERTIAQIAECLQNQNLDSTLESIKSLRGICYATSTLTNLPSDYITLPSYDEITQSKSAFKNFFNTFYQNTNPNNAVGLVQQYGGRYVVQNPPNYYLTGDELDEVYEMDFENAAHPLHSTDGKVIGIETTLFSVSTHRGCFGECNFCAIAVHQGREIRSRSSESIVREVSKFTADKRFKGNINDLGGATANMYGMECSINCNAKRCLYPTLCKQRNINHSKHLRLIKKVESIENVKRVFINSGLRYDLIQYDKKFGSEYLAYIVSNCMSGQMKIAPEHTDRNVLNAMGKGNADLTRFCDDFYTITDKVGKRQFLTYYLIAGHPGCSMVEMEGMRNYFIRELHILPEQVQIFTPTPSTYSTLMYWIEEDLDGNEIYVEKDLQMLAMQKELMGSQNYDRKYNRNYNKSRKK